MRKTKSANPFVEDLSPLLGQLTVQQDHSRRLDGPVHREVLADHDTEDTSEQTRLQSPCRASHTGLPFTTAGKSLGWGRSAPGEETTKKG